MSNNHASAGGPVNDGRNRPSGSPPTRAWYYLALGLLAAIAVWSPLAGSVLAMSFIAGLCALALLALARTEATITRASAGKTALVVTAVLLIAMFATSIYGVTSSMPWLSWVASTATLPIVGVGVWLSERQASAHATF